MANKLQMYADLADTQARQITGSRESWTGFLGTAGRLYKYPFDEQLLIYAQRPDATACATFDTWHEPMNRFIKRGSKGIALIDDSGAAPRLRYVFDVADTYGARQNARKPYVWELKPEHDRAVIESIDKAYHIGSLMGWDGIDGKELVGHEVGDVIFGLAHSLAARYYEENAGDVSVAAEGSFLENYGEPDVKAAFRDALAVSAAYTIMTRCGIGTSEYLTDEDFMPVFDFNTPAAVSVLGSAVSAVSEEVLRNIEVTIKNYERQNAVSRIPFVERSTTHERTDVHETGGLSDPGRGDQGIPAPGQVRDAAEILPQTAPEGAVHEPVATGGIVPPLSGNRADGEREAGTHDARNAGERPAPGQSDRPAGMGGAHEHDASPGGGSHLRGTDLQLNTEPTGAPTEQSGGVSASKPAITEADITEYLKTGSMVQDGKYRIFSYFLHDHDTKEQAAFLKNEYGYGGGTYYFPDGSHGHADAQPSRGITLGKGAYGNPDAEVTLTWTNAAHRIERLISDGLYMSPDELNHLPTYERQMLGAEIINFYGDVPGERPEYVTSMFDDYWRNAQILGDTLDNPERAAELLASMRPIMESTPGGDRYHDIRQKALDDLTAFADGTYTLFPNMPFTLPVQAQGEPVREAAPQSTKTETQAPAAITQDDIDAALVAWNGDGGSINRVCEYMRDHARARDTASFIQREYGQPAFTVAKGGAGNPGGAESVTLPWAKVQMRVAQLIGAGVFVPVPEQPQAEQPLAEAPAEAHVEPAAPVSGEAPAAQPTLEPTTPEPTSPKPVFLREKNEIHGMDLSLYGDGDVIGYDKNGVEYSISRVGEYNFINTTTRITPMGDILGMGDIPPDILRQICVANGLETEEPAEPESGYTASPAAPEAEPAQMNLFDLAAHPQHTEPAPEREPAAAPAPVAPEAPASEPQAAANFRITDDHLGEGGAKTKFRRNMDAIHLLHDLEFDKRAATPEEQQILSQYVGWGGLPQAFDPDNKQWADEYMELITALSTEDYDKARASTLGAYYTSPTVIKAMYDTLERLGVRDGNILEPACGVGNFFGLIPDSMAGAKLYGVELDSITGRIAKQLYPQADIQITGFEKTNTPDAFFDAAVGNVPFGGYKVSDRRYDKHNFQIHDFFFAKTLDQVRPGGIVAFITSKGTLDKASPEVRKYIAQRAELLGAVRLPNNAFLKNAGTEVTSDIIFLQKRDRLIDIEPDWVHLGLTDEGIPVNSYFEEHPEMILGTMAYDSGLYGGEKETTCNPIEGADLSEQLRAALSRIQGQITENEIDDIEGIQDTSIPADPAVRNFSYTVVDGAVYYRENSRMNPVEMPALTLERVKGMIALRDCVRELIDLQLYDHPDSDIQAKQRELNTLYDGYTRKFGLINDSANKSAFSADSAYYLLCSLEVLDENDKLKAKSDMFTKRTVRQNVEITHADTSAEALAVSIANKARVDIGYMMALTGFTEEKITADLQGVIFRDAGAMPVDSIPLSVYDLDRHPYVTADEYLSGNVRAKLQTAEYLAEHRPDLVAPLAPNIAALREVQPKDLDASEISVRLGSTWIDPEYIRQFICELLQPPSYRRDGIEVHYSAHSGEWGVEGKNGVGFSDITATVTYGTERINAYKIIEDTLNLKDVRIYDTKYVDGQEVRVLNQKETTLAAQKQEAIKNAFRDWIFRDPQRRRTLVALYNERFNSVRPREYDGSHITLTGMSPELTLKQHQKDAIARILYSGNTLLAHEVGAGKTFEMVGAAMEGKHLGLCHKSLIAVPNHLTEQMASEFLRMYPSANILVAMQKDFETRNRKKFCARIATGDYDAVIIGHSQLEKIPLSKERQERLLQDQIDDITEGIEELKENHGERFTIKQMEKTRKSLEAKLERLTDDSRKDDVVTFEQLGVDRLFVDESQAFKNLFLYTKMRNVAGLSASDAQKSSDMFLKCRYIDEITGNKGVVFATGTPVTNSMTELYTLQRYLQYDAIQAAGLAHFDSWASIFGETQTSVELAPEGNGYRARTRFAKFNNVPELMAMFKEVADIKTADTLDLQRPIAHYITKSVEPTDLQKEMVLELSARTKAVHNKQVDSHVDNMLKITSDGRKIGLDQRLMNPMLPDDPGSKVNVCTDNIYDIWERTADKRLTQICFCDFSTPNADGRFNVYDDMEQKLIAKGVPADEIAFIHDAATEAQKKKLFAQVRKGKIRVLFGSTFKLGAGTNVQDRLIAIHDLDCPWRPSDLEQRAGRIVRQGNMNPEVSIFRYVTNGTFDSYLFQTLEKKQQFISQIMTSKSPVRSCEDVDEQSLSYAEIKALCAGNPKIKEKMELDIDVSRLRLLKSDHQSQQYRLQDDIAITFPKNIEANKGFIEGFKQDLKRLETHTHEGEEGIAPMTIGDKTYTDRGEAGAALLEAAKAHASTEPVKIGSYRGFDMLVSFTTIGGEYHIDMKGAMTHKATLGDDASGNITRINNAFDRIPQRLQSTEAQLQMLCEQIENARVELDKPFAFDQELADKTARLAVLDAELNMDNAPAAPPVQAEAAKAPPSVVKAEPPAAKGKPSLMETLRINEEKSHRLFGRKPADAEKPKEASL